MQDLDALKTDILSAIQSSDSVAELDAIRVDALGKKGRVSGLLKQLGAMDPDARKEMGQNLNILKTEIAEALAAKEEARAQQQRAEELEARRAARRAAREQQRADRSDEQAP